MPTDPNVEEVRILNSENHTYYYQYLRRDRLQAFYWFLEQNRQPNPPVSPMPGLSGLAIAGLDAIFDRRPLKFPVNDILSWLRENQGHYVPASNLDLKELEYGLEQFSKLYPPDAGEAR